MAAKDMSAQKHGQNGPHRNNRLLPGVSEGSGFRAAIQGISFLGGHKMRTGLKMLTAVLCASASMMAPAAGDTASTMDSTKFLVGQFSDAAPPAAGPERERAQAVNGNLYAVVAPLYVTQPFLSYLRLVNAGGTEATFTVTVVGSGTATAYGTATYTVPSAATLQLPMSPILVAANAVTRDDADVQFSFYIQSPQPLAGYQHVTLHSTEKYFENASVCKYNLSQLTSASANQIMLPSIHTSRLGDVGYPAQIEIHNFANAPVTYRFFVRDEATGTLLNPGGLDFPTQANASYTIPWSQIQSQIGFNPTESQLRVNMIVTDPSGAPPAALVSQTIVNTAFSVSINMTSTCAVNAPQASGGDGGGLPGGGISY
jgi:hypothetical protein